MKQLPQLSQANARKSSNSETSLGRIVESLEYPAIEKRFKELREAEFKKLECWLCLYSLEHNVSYEGLEG